MVDIVKNQIETIGNVDISVYNGKRCIQKINGHNTGTVDLCRFLVNALSGDNVIANRPGRIIPFDSDGNNFFEFGVPYLPDTVEVRDSGDEAKNNPGKSESNESSYAEIKFGFIIPNTLLPKSKTIHGFRLFRNTLDENGGLVKYAEIKLSEIGAEPISLETGTVSLRVDWIIKLSVSNS